VRAVLSAMGAVTDRIGLLSSRDLAQVPVRLSLVIACRVGEIVPTPEADAGI
jgi:hypothetical protein